VPAGLGDGVVELSPWRARDLPALAEASRDSAITSITAVPPTASRAAGLEFIRARLQAARAGEALSMAILDSATGRTVGGINLNSLDWRRRAARAGYWVLVAHRQRGVASRALRLLTEWAFAGPLALEQLELRAEPGNAASIAVARSVGYAPAGTIVAPAFGQQGDLELVRFTRAREGRRE
jgi:RimJ/RimL family protein N-acetyltransferase